MKWVPQEIQAYLSAKEYVDTAVIPVYSISLGDGMKESGAKHEFITLLATLIERHFTGRVMLFPPFTYLKSKETERTLNRLRDWEDDIEKNDFKHIFYITSESDWKQHEKELHGSVLWLPSIPLDSMNEGQKYSIVESQVKQLSDLFTQKWVGNYQN